MQGLLAQLTGKGQHQDGRSQTEQPPQVNGANIAQNVSINKLIDSDKNASGQNCLKPAICGGHIKQNPNLLACPSKITENTTDKAVKTHSFMQDKSNQLSARVNDSRVSSTSTRTTRNRSSSAVARRKPQRNRTESRSENGTKCSQDDERKCDSIVPTGFDDGTDQDSNPDPILAPAQAWAAFENAVKNIDCANSDHFAKQPKPNFLSSGTFQDVMVDMYGNVEYGNTNGYTVLKMKLNNMARATGLASRMMNSAVAKGQEDREREEEENKPEVDVIDSPEPENALLHDNVRRGWRLLKREVNDQIMENNTQTVKLNWAMLQHTLRKMANPELARQDLYERYGILPTKLPDGRTVCENIMLSERARAKINTESNDNEVEEHDIKRPVSCQPSSIRSRSRTGHRNGQEERRRGKSAKGLSRRTRPKTAV